MSLWVYHFSISSLRAKILRSDKRDVVYNKPHLSHLSASSLPSKGEERHASSNYHSGLFHSVDIVYRITHQSLCVFLRIPVILIMRRRRQCHLHALDKVSGSVITHFSESLLENNTGVFFTLGIIYSVNYNVIQFCVIFIVVCDGASLVCETLNAWPSVSRRLNFGVALIIRWRRTRSWEAERLCL